MIGISPARRDKAETRRQQILGAASDCVRRAGFHGASMAEIAQMAKLSTGQIYRYFENKEAIVAAIVVEDLAEMREKFAECETSGPPLLETVVAKSALALDRNSDPDRAALVLEVLAEAARNHRVAKIVRDADSAERALGRKLLEQILPDDRSVADLGARGEVIMMLFDGMIMRAVSNPASDRAAVAKLVQSVMRFLLTGPALDEVEENSSAEE